MPGLCTFGIFCPFRNCHHDHGRLGSTHDVAVATSVACELFPQDVVGTLERFHGAFEDGADGVRAYRDKCLEKFARHVNASDVTWLAARQVSLHVLRKHTDRYDEIETVIASIFNAPVARRNVKVLQASTEVDMAPRLDSVGSSSADPPPVASLPPRVQYTKNDDVPCECYMCYEDIDPAKECWTLKHVDSSGCGVYCEDCRTTPFFEKMTQCYRCEKPLDTPKWQKIQLTCHLVHSDIVNDLRERRFKGRGSSSSPRRKRNSQRKSRRSSRRRRA